MLHGWRFARPVLVVLVDVVVRHLRKGRHRIVQTRGGHAPRADGRPEQVNRVPAGSQPVSKDVPVQRVQHQAFGAAGCSGDDAHVARAQAMFTQRRQRVRAGVDGQGFGWTGLADTSLRVSIRP